MRHAHHSKATRAMLVNVANWLRCRKLANASPAAVWLTQGAHAAAEPKYWRSPKPLLTKPASSQEAATTNASRAGDITSARQIRRPSRAAAQAQANNSGTTAGEGPGANGLSQGRRRRVNTTKFSMVGRIAG